MDLTVTTSLRMRGKAIDGFLTVASKLKHYVDSFVCRHVQWLYFKQLGCTDVIKTQQREVIIDLLSE